MPKQIPLLQEITKSPLLLADNSEQVFMAAIEYVVSHERAEQMLNARMAANDDEFWGNPDDPDDWLHYYRPYHVVDGVLQIPIYGVLLHQYPWQMGRWATGYKYIEMALKRGLADPNVKAIALVIDSPGGEVRGCFELGDMLYEAREEKPIRAFAADSAYSAAYVMFSSANDNRVTRSGGVGSIGVVTAHVSYAGALEKAGIEFTFIHAPEDGHKIDGNPYNKLSKPAKERIQAKINKIYDLFVSTVVRNRGMEDQAVRDTKALTYDADEAVTIGLADRVGVLEDELAIFATEVENEGDFFMATQPNVTGKAPLNSNEQAITPEAHEAAVETARAEGMEAGATAERERISAILGSEEGQKRPKAAMAMVELGVSAEKASAQLAKLPEETAAAAPAQETETSATNPVTGKPTAQNRDHFAEHMSKSQQPNLTHGDNGDEGEEQSPKAQANSILASYGRAAGISKKSA